MHKFFFLIVVMLVGITACKSENLNDIPMPEDFKKPRHITQEESINISRFWTRDEAYKIKRFVERNEWKTKRTESGLYCYVYSKKAEGEKAEPGQLAVINYKVRLIDADTTLCYESLPNQPEEVLIEMDNVESGLHEALTYLKKGESAYVVLPHYLAHGLAGDLDKIPPLSPVLYDIELIDLK